MGNSNSVTVGKLTDFFSQNSHISFKFHLLHFDTSVPLVTKHKLEFSTSWLSGGKQIASEGCMRKMSSYWLNREGAIRTVVTSVTSHCQDPILPTTSVVTSSWIVPILKHHLK